VDKIQNELIKPLVPDKPARQEELRRRREEEENPLHIR
jgi:hypothetical protein